MQAQVDTPEPLRFASFELDVRSRELRNGVHRVRLQEQPFEILRLMLERPGDVVTREELRQRLWPNGTFVDFEHSLNAAVKRLRAALGDDADNPRFVETLPRRGYRFIAKLDNVGDRGVTRVAALVRPQVRLAVLPFTNLSDDPAQEYFSDGLTEELIAQLGVLTRGRIGVLARWSSMVFKGTSCGAREIGAALRANYLLEGSVRCDGDRVRITARLIEADSETHLWSETYERHLSDCCSTPSGPLSVQTDVAARVARSLAMELAPPPSEIPECRPPSPLAYQAYLKGRYHWNKPGDEGLEQAMRYFVETIALEPSFGAGYAALARAWIGSAEYYRTLPRRALERGRETAMRALALDPELSEGHLALADAYRMLAWDWDSAESAFAQAIALNPSYESAHRGYGVMLACLSRKAEAIREVERACELDPLCLTVNTSAAWVQYTVGDYDGAIERCRHTIDMEAQNVTARRVLGAACLQAGRPDAALRELEAAMTVSPDDPVVLAWLSHALATSGDRTRAVALVARIRELDAVRYVPSYHLALAHVGIGNVDEAFAALETAYVDRDPVLANVAIDPRFDPLRLDARYRQLLERLNLTAP
jgi:TolB-like protein/tetratricopeptide (TPR) repeat protein